MSCPGKLVSELEINAAAEELYKIFKDRAFHCTNISPKYIQEVKVHEGDWDNHGHGSIKIWNYTIDNKAGILKERVEFDDEKLKISLIGLEGDMFDDYKIFNLIYQYVPKGPKHSLAILTVEYEKLNDDSPYPYKYLDAMNGITKDMESHLK